MFPGPWTYRELAHAAQARLAFDFDRAAHVMSCLTACLSSNPISPKTLNPYRACKRIEYDVDDIERSHRAHVKGGRLIEQSITMEQVNNG